MSAMDKLHQSGKYNFVQGIKEYCVQQCNGKNQGKCKEICQPLLFRFTLKRACPRGAELSTLLFSFRMSQNSASAFDSQCIPCRAEQCKAERDTTARVNIQILSEFWHNKDQQGYLLISIHDKNTQDWQYLSFYRVNKRIKNLLILISRLKISWNAKTGLKAHRGNCAAGRLDWETQDQEGSQVRRKKS